MNVFSGSNEIGPSRVSVFHIDHTNPHTLRDSIRMGIEVEVEGVVYHIAFQELKWWRPIGDNSLRDGLEFITLFGITFGQVGKAIQELREVLQSLHPNFSERTSVHIHFDVCAITSEEIKFLGAVFLFVEDILFSMVHKQRKHNIYCKPIS